MKSTLLYHLLCLPVIIAVAVIYIFKLGGEQVITFAGDSFLIVLCAIASLMLLSVVRSFKSWDSAKLTWAMIMTGTTTYLVAELVYFYLEVVKQVGEEALYPSAADIFYCSAYVFYLAGLLTVIIAYIKSGLSMGNWKIYFLTITAVFILIAWVMYAVLLKPIALDTETGGLEKFLYFFYPVSDLTLIFPTLIMVYITYLLGKGMFSRPWRALVLGFIIMTVADISYSYLDWQDLYKTGNLIDLLWGVSYWLIGLSGIYQKKIMDSI